MSHLTRSDRSVQTWSVGCPVRAAVGEDEGVGSPGVGGAHVQRVGRGGAYVPGGVQVGQLASLVVVLGAVGVVFAEALVHVTVEDDALGRA